MQFSLAQLASEVLFVQSWCVYMFCSFWCPHCPTPPPIPPHPHCLLLTKNNTPTHLPLSSLLVISFQRGNDFLCNWVYFWGFPSFFFKKKKKKKKLLVLNCYLHHSTLFGGDILKNYMCTVLLCAPCIVTAEVSFSPVQNASRCAWCIHWQRVASGFKLIHLSLHCACIVPPPHWLLFLSIFLFFFYSFLFFSLLI